MNKLILATMILVGLSISPAASQSGNEAVGTLPHTTVIKPGNVEYAPFSMTYGDYTIESEDMAAAVAAEEAVEMISSWRWRGIDYQVKTFRRANEAYESHAKRHKKATEAAMEVFPPDRPVTGS